MFFYFLDRAVEGADHEWLFFVPCENGPAACLAGINRNYVYRMLKQKHCVARKE